MAYEMITRTGKSFWLETSIMQNAIRKGNYEIAGECMWELIPKYEQYLRKRFLVISAEDCYGIITKEVLNLTKQEGQESLERALSLMCEAKKNRDADYFVCNLMIPGVDTSKEELVAGLKRHIKNKDVVKAGKYSIALFRKNRKLLWSTLHDIAKQTNPDLVDEFLALEEANETVTKPTEETIFVAKAIVLLWTERESKYELLGYRGMRCDGAMNPDDVRIIKPIEFCEKVRGHYPDWAYNWHTYRGKYALKRDAIHAITNDQELLTPLEENLFDDCSWNRDINACLLKWNPRNILLPYDDGKIKPEEKFPSTPDDPEPVQMSLF